MKKTNFTFHESILSKGMSFLIVLLFCSLTGTTTLSAQCSLACNGTTNVSLDNACGAVITPAMILNDNATSCPAGAYMVEVMEEMNGNPIPTVDSITSEYVGMTLFVKITDSNSGNSCWGEVVVEDKIAPTITCTPPVGPVYCFDVDNFEPTATDNCDPNPEVIILNETITTNNCDGALPDSVIMRIDRTYQAMDASGMTSNTCTLTFDVSRLESLDVIDAPMNFILDDALNCSDTFARDENGNPDVSVTGVPTLNDTIPLFPTPFASCNIVVTKEDIDLPPIGCVKKLMRIFTVVEWSCGMQRTREIVQMIEISDNEGPVITDCPTSFLASTSNYECTGIVNLPAVGAMDLCSPTIEVDVAFPGGFLDNQNGGLAELPLGDNLVTYTVYDECLNSSTCSIIVSVEDLTPPVAVCDQFTAVGLTNDGYAYVEATVFDDGSYDECDLERMLVRRMDTDECGDCDAPVFTGFTALGTYNGHYYYLSDDELTGRLAAKHSIALGGYGLSLETADERNWLYSVVEEDVSFYIGLSTNGGSTYSWASNQPLTSTDWATGEPSDNEQYVIYDEALDAWNDVDGFAENRYIVEVPIECSYSEYTRFCCADIGNENMVVFRVIDAACNFNECMVNVDVQDKIGPVVACPDDITVSCDTPYDLNDLSQFGEATVFDNCGFEMAESVVTDFNQCQMGDLFRTFTVTDDGGRVSSCTQTITFINEFSVNGNQIVFPADVYLDNGCSDPNSSDFDPVNTGLPIYPNTPCQLLGLNIDDQVFIFNDDNTDACFKILRTFTVINWCEEDPVTGLPLRYQDFQIIKVNNTVDPTITGSCERVTVCTYDAECADGAVTLTQSATDDCTDVLNYEYNIDFDNNGTVDFTRNGEGNSADASGVYPIGSHKITWTFLDKCGNSTSCEQLFDVVNCKAPTPYCLDGIAVTLMPVDNDGDGVTDGGMRDIWANDFDAGSTHPCGYDVVFSFSPDTSDTSVIFDCGDVGEQEVSIYATSVSPDGQLLQAFCVTHVNVQDNNQVCGEGLRPTIDGHVSTVYNDMLDDVRVDLLGTENMYEMTAEGSYAFPEMPSGGNYLVDPTKNDDVNNGVSTLDLVLIQRHVIGLQDLDSPYKMIAADINNDQDVSSADIVELRKVILGVKDEFQNNESWSFLDASFTFPDASDPWVSNLPQDYEIENLSSDMTIDFTAVKIGDVNNSVTITNATSQSSEIRSNESLSMIADMTNISNVGNMTIPVYADAATDLSGLQMTIDLSNCSFANIESGRIQINESNVGLRYADRGLVTFSWDASNGVEITEGDLLFTLDVQNASVDSRIAISSEITAAEAFNKDFEVMNINLSTRSINSELNGFELLQNEPNPFNDYTNVSFNLPKAMDATFTVFDVNGRILKEVNSSFEKGTNTIRLTKSDLQVSGILHYQLKAGDFTATKKMVVFN